MNIRIHDDLLPADEHKAIYELLCGAKWEFGGRSSDAPEADSYFYWQVAGGFSRSVEKLVAADYTAALAEASPAIARVWARVRPFCGGRPLGRCYANAMAAGIEGSVHQDSNMPEHLTAIYYPNLTWSAELGGETLFFNPARDDVVAAIYPRPNRLVVFPGTAPHVARPMSKRSPGLRVTLMFKTL